MQPLTLHKPHQPAVLGCQPAIGGQRWRHWRLWRRVGHRLTDEMLTMAPGWPPSRRPEMNTFMPMNSEVTLTLNTRSHCSSEVSVKRALPGTPAKRLSSRVHRGALSTPLTCALHQHVGYTSESVLGRFRRSGPDILVAVHVSVRLSSVRPATSRHAPFDEDHPIDIRRLGFYRLAQVDRHHLCALRDEQIHGRFAAVGSPMSARCTVEAVSTPWLTCRCCRQ
jgi:hypothetical protein